MGRAGSAWDDEDYVCPRCRGVGLVALSELVTRSSVAGAAAKGLAKAQPAADADARERRRRQKAG